MNDPRVIFAVGFLLTVLDFVVSSLGSIGYIGIQDLKNININKIIATFLCIVINVVLPVISISVLKNLFKKSSQSTNQTSETPPNSPLSFFIEFFKGILIYIIVYPTVILLDFYTTFLGVVQSFFIDRYSHSGESTKINFTTIWNDFCSSNEDKLFINEDKFFIIAVSIILLTGHFILAGNKSGHE